MKLNILLIIAIICFCCFAAQAQTISPTVCDSGKIKPKEWINKGVSYIITATERKAFYKLQNDIERESFIENFWSRRDPDPGTEINEFKEEYCQRIAHANENFASGIPGWKTDRGRIYLVLGKPDKIDKGKGNFENLTDILFEKWLYLTTKEGRVEILFLDLSESNEYRMRVTEDTREKTLRLLNPNGLTVSNQ